MGTAHPVLQSKKIRIAAVLICCLILVIGFSLYRTFFYRMKAGTLIGGADVSGMTPVQARSALSQALEETLYTHPLQVHLPEETLCLSPETLQVQIKLKKALFDHMHGKPAESLRPYLQAEEDSLYSLLEAYADQYDTALTQASWKLEGAAPDLSTAHFNPKDAGQMLVLTMGIPEQHLDIQAVSEEILEAFSQAVALCQTDSYQITPEVLPEALPNTPSAAVIAGQIRKMPENDTIDREQLKLLQGSYGIDLDANKLRNKIRQAEYGETITYPLEYPPPEILGEQAYFQDVLASFETRHTNDSNRNHNLKLQCEALDGFVLQPGEVFSMNEVVGERTLERGYLPAPAYSGNRLVNSPGGGVCQGTTTLYNCVLLADLEVVFRACHGVRVGYVPLGLDAAVNWLTTDFQFKNNFTCPIQLKAWLEGGYVKMQILGIDEKDYYIKMETGSGEDEFAYYARSYKCKYDKETDELISREVETYSTYYKDIE